ncbi:hypothetical protein GCM10010524_57540 [Streptomyces mexicanus]
MLCGTAVRAEPCAPAAGVAGCADTPGRACRPPAGSAYAVHTEVAAATAVTPSAAASTRPCQPRPPPCRTMSAPLLAVCVDPVH